MRAFRLIPILFGLMLGGVWADPAAADLRDAHLGARRDWTRPPRILGEADAARNSQRGRGHGEDQRPFHHPQLPGAIGFAVQPHCQ